MLLTRKRVLAAKIETTAGTAETLSASEAAFNVFNFQTQPAIEYQEREGQAAFGRLPGVLGPRGGKATFSTELYGSGGGAIPNWASVFLPACGWVATAQVYSPVSAPPGSSVKTLTIAAYENGVKKILRGCMGSFKFNLAAGKIAMIDWEFTGIWGAPTDVGILAPTYPTLAPMRFANTSVAIASYHPKLSALMIDCGNAVILREDAEDPSGYSTALVGDRKVTGTLDPESNLVATQDTYGQWLAGTQQALAVVFDDGALDKITLTAPKLQFTNVQEGDRAGNQIDQLTFACNRSAAAGDDEFTITFAAHS